jgi:glycosyltransferase involved in cell wall biosynthesis
MSESRKPHVTVAIPTYRGERFIGAAIESVLNQTFADFELFVIDDNSPDNTHEIVESYSDARLFYLKNEQNLGPKGNWNRCLEVASGNYFKLLPHDDLLASNCLERQVEILDADQDEQISLIFSSREVLGPDGCVILTHRGYPGGIEGCLSNDTVIRACVRRGTNLIGEPGAVLFRKSLADRVGHFDATNPYVIDLDYWFRLLAHGDAYYCDEDLASFRVSAQSWSVAIGKGQSQEFHEFVARISTKQTLHTTLFDRFCGRFTPDINSILRHIFYNIYIR